MVIVSTLSVGRIIVLSIVCVLFYVCGPKVRDRQKSRGKRGGRQMYFQQNTIAQKSVDEDWTKGDLSAGE
jgi:hypothetical protein